VGLTSIHWREAWKYGERAFRYCQHDAGHAIAALRFAASLLGWRLTLLPAWSDAQIASVLGVDRVADFADAEREEPDCIAVVTAGELTAWMNADPEVLAAAARAARWSGQANALSPARVEWPIIDEVAVATRRVGAALPMRSAEPVPHRLVSHSDAVSTTRNEPRARQIILRRRSAVAFDARSSLPRAAFISMLARTRQTNAPWDAIHWAPRIHLLLFVHRVDGLTPGVYAYLRDPSVLEEWRAAMRTEFLWEPVPDPTDPNDPNAPNALYLLLPFDVTWVANRVSCDQDIAADGFFSLGMIARLESTLREQGDWSYRRLFWESGMIGQTLYLEAEAAGARATGIGCFYDDPVHEAAGLSSMEWQSIITFRWVCLLKTIGSPPSRDMTGKLCRPGPTEPRHRARWTRHAVLTSVFLALTSLAAIAGQPNAGVVTGRTAARAFVFQGQPIHPFCVDFPLERSSRSEPRALMDCGDPRVTPKPAPGGFLSAEYPTEPGERFVSFPPYAAYRVLAHKGDRFLIATEKSGGGSGQFTELFWVRLDAGRIALVKDETGGDRCLGGLGSYQVRGASMRFSQSQSAHDLIASSGVAVPAAVKDALRSGYQACDGSAVYQYDFKTERMRLAEWELNSPEPPNPAE
jgi:nitroreductase